VIDLYAHEAVEGQAGSHWGYRGRRRSQRVILERFRIGSSAARAAFALGIAGILDGGDRASVSK